MTILKHLDFMVQISETPKEKRLYAISKGFQRLKSFMP